MSDKFADVKTRMTRGLIGEGDIFGAQDYKDIAWLLKETEGLRTALTAALEQNERFAAELGKLRTLIDAHNDERRECPVIEA